MISHTHEEDSRKANISKIKREEMEIDAQLSKYNDKIKGMERELEVLDRKKRRVLKVLDANRARQKLIRRDMNQSAYRLDEIHEKIESFGTLLEKAKEVNQREMNEVRSLKASILEQLSAVEEHITAIANMGGGWESNTKESIQQCTLAKTEMLKTYSRWSSVWPALQVWLTADMDSSASMAALSSLEGFVGEWVALRSLACDIKAITESTNRQGGKGMIHAHSFKLALSTLNFNTQSANEKTLSDIAILQKEVSALEKQRRQMRSLLLDLNYALEEDIASAATNGKHVASAANIAVQNPPSEDTEIHSKEVNLATGDIIPIHEDRNASANLHDSDPKESTGGMSRRRSMDNTTTKQYVQKNFSLTERWMRQLYIHTGSALAQAMDRAVTANSDDVVVPPSSSAPSPRHNSRHKKSESLNRVPFNTQQPSTESPSVSSNAEAWQSMDCDEMKAALTALECRSVWRKLQMSAAEYAAQTYENTDADWNYLLGMKQEAGDSSSSRKIMNGVTISLPGNGGTVKHTFPPSRPQTSATAERNDTAVQSGVQLLGKGVRQYQEWMAFHRLSMQASNVVESPCPCAPQQLVLQLMKVARGPAVRHQASVYSMNPDMQNKLDLSLGGAGKSGGVQFAPVTSTRGRNRQTSENDRLARKTERKRRMQTLVRKFQISAQNAAEKRGAMVVNEKYRIPKFVPKFDTTESPRILKPSDIIKSSSNICDSSDDSDSNRSVHNTSSDDDDDFETRKMITEVAQETSTKHGSADSLNLRSNSIEDIRSHISDSLPEKYSMLERMINKDIDDQVISQLTLRMGGEPINLVVYWLPREECIKINAFCFQG